MKYRYADAPQPLRDFFVYMETIQGKSAKTVDEYYLDLRTFFRYIKYSRGLVADDVSFSEIDIKDVTLDMIEHITLSDVYDYLNYTVRDRQNAPAARALKYRPAELLQISSQQGLYYKDQPRCGIGISQTQ